MWQWSIFWCHNQAAPNISKHFFVLFSPVYVLPQWSHSHLLLSCTSACFLTFSHFHIVEMGAMQEPQEPHFFPPLLLCCFCCRCQDVSSKLDDDSRSSPLIVWWVGQMKIFFWSTNYCQQTINDIIVRPCGDDIDGSKLWRHDLECPWDSICVQENPTGFGAGACTTALQIFLCQWDPQGEASGTKCVTFCHSCGAESSNHCRNSKNKWMAVITGNQNGN